MTTDIERLREALKPFAEAAEGLDPSDKDGWLMWEHPQANCVSVGDFRRAAEAYAALESTISQQADELEPVDYIGQIAALKEKLRIAEAVTENSKRAHEILFAPPAVGDGWKIVPVEPGIVSILEEIEKQMEHSLDCYCLPLWPEEAAVIVRIARAMLSASPGIPERPSTDEKEPS